MIALEQQIPNNPGMYIISNLNNDVQYVGSASNLNNRRLSHLSELRKKVHHNKMLQLVYDSGSNLFITFHITKTRDEAFDLEQAYLDEHHGTKYLCNIAKDARVSWSGLTHSKETKTKISLAAKGNLHCLGRRYSEQTRKKIAQTSLGRKHSVKTKHIISLTHLGKPKTEEHKAKQREAAINDRGVSVMVKDYVNNLIVIYGSIVEAMEATRLTRRIIVRALESNKFKLKAGYAFQRANIDTFKQWPSYSFEEALKSRQSYFS